MREAGIPSRRRRLAKAVVVVQVCAGREQALPGLPGELLDRMRRDELPHRVNRRGRVRRRRGPDAARVEPRHGVSRLSRQRDGGARLQRHRDHPRLAGRLRAQDIGERRGAQRRGAVPLARLAAVGDWRLGSVGRTAHLGGVRAIPPAVSDHAVARRKAAGGDRCVTGAGDGGAVWIRGIFEPGSVIDQPPQAGMPLVAVCLDVAGA